MTVEELLKKYAAGERNFAGINLTEANLSGVNLSGANLKGANLSVANLSGANLSKTNLTGAKLNIARLSGAHLGGADLTDADLNVAYLVRVDLKKATLIGAKLIRAELIRAELSGANLQGANLSGATLTEATLRGANLEQANLRGAHLSGACLTEANLEQANLQGADLSRADLSGADLRGTELRQANLTQAVLSGADLSGVNLRWAILSGCNLRWADLSEAKLSGADLSRADLCHADLSNASLVHADLSNAYLIRADWIGADLTGATLTGAKLHAVSRLGIKTEGMTCKWVDLSPNGDHSQIYWLNSGGTHEFFHETLPTVRIVIDSPLDQGAHFALAATYYQIAQQYPSLSQPPTIEVSSRRTVLAFKMDSDDKLFATAYVAIIPFNDAATTQKNLIALMKMIQSHDAGKLNVKESKHVQLCSKALNQAISKVDQIKISSSFPKIGESINFFQIPTQMILINSRDQRLSVYHHPAFGKRLIKKYEPSNSPSGKLAESTKLAQANITSILDFIKGFHNIDV
ncbi:pentapeptide repeat-containing protein [Microcoleus sp. LAD1_D5]|uniref:pentapeptide repeat-containing protein n=1 Tax=unclassified Microcoleus TaxID=2642155 RepID=UPI002FD37C1C